MYSVFAIMFPAVCGMMEGANLSGDLKDPAFAIPYGTVAAVTTAFFFYICLIVGQAGSMDNEALWYNMNVMQVRPAAVPRFRRVLGLTFCSYVVVQGRMHQPVLRRPRRRNGLPVHLPWIYVRLLADLPGDCAG